MPTRLRLYAKRAWPTPNAVDEMHEALMSLAAISEDEVQANEGWRVAGNLGPKAVAPAACYRSMPSIVYQLAAGIQ